MAPVYLSEPQRQMLAGRWVHLHLYVPTCDQTRPAEKIQHVQGFSARSVGAGVLILDVRVKPVPDDQSGRKAGEKS